MEKFLFPHMPIIILYVSMCTFIRKSYEQVTHLKGLCKLEMVVMVKRKWLQIRCAVRERMQFYSDITIIILGKIVIHFLSCTYIVLLSLSLR